MAMQALSYDVDAGKAQILAAAEGRSDRRTGIVAVVLAVVFAAAAFLFDDLFVGVATGLLSLVFLFIGSIGILLAGSDPPSAEALRKQLLELDAEGFSRWEADQRVRRYWHEVSHFQVIASPYKVLEGAIVFNEMGGWAWPRIWRWARRPRQPYGLAAINDIYRAPIGEIAAQLNAYRDAALDRSGPNDDPKGSGNDPLAT